MTKPFNPLDKANLAESIERALASERPRPLRSIDRFCGAGVYALYYVGDYPAYRRLSECNKVFLDAPIYVGKADSKGRRKGGFLAEDAAGVTLWKRLGDHASSIEQADNLDIGDFLCRFLVVDDLWVGLGESLLISKYSPVWNTLVDGFGNHAPGKGRGAGKRSRWDTLHPGRPWAVALAENPMSAEQIGREVSSYIEERYDVVSL
ncbi:MAG: Eco29kI family restriction endonuclease [Eggerthellaceae bacterium]|nr:Eco29kI family restriction endonuclease [Eggerthellaceae bacterium]